MSQPPKRPARVVRRPGEWKPEEKLRLLVQAEGLEGEALGELLRREGLHEADLGEWQRAALGGLGPVMKTASSSAETRRVRERERELLCKDKALAETAALLVLKKRSPGVPAGRGRQHEEGDRQVIVDLIEEAVSAGARCDKACETFGFALVRSLGGVPTVAARTGVVRPACRPRELTAAEQARVVGYATSTEYHDLSPR